MRWLQGQIVDYQFKKWKRRHPAATFAEFYANRVDRKIRVGRPHKTLGTRGWKSRHGPGVDFDRCSFATRGLEIWAQILRFGLKPEMRCVDYGCGSLRIGQHAMRYLDVGNYWGVDVTDAFIVEGLKLIDPMLLDERLPRLGTIDARTLGEIRMWQPDFIFANAVLLHVPPTELGLFFKRLEAMMVPKSKAVIIYVSNARTQRVKSMNWVYSDSALKQAAQNAGASLSLSFEDVRGVARYVDGRPRRALILQRHEASTVRQSAVTA